jgi:hypothetical protein
MCSRHGVLLSFIAPDALNLSDDPFEISWLVDRRKDRERENSLFAPGNLLLHDVQTLCDEHCLYYCRILQNRIFFVTYKASDCKKVLNILRLLQCIWVKKSRDVIAILVLMSSIIGVS